MNDPVIWVRLGGVLQLGVLIASILVPKVLRWHRELASLHVMLRRLIWVYGVFIVFTITALGVICVTFAETIVTGSGLGRAIAIFVAGFWGMRLLVQLFVFDMLPLLDHPILKLGYHGLTIVFTYLFVVFTIVALAT